MFNICTVKNIDSETHNVLGVQMAPNEVYTIPDNKRLKASNDSNIITKVSSGLLQIGDGSSYFNTVGEQINYLKSGIKSVAIDEINATVEAKNGIKGFKVGRSNSNIALSTSYSDLLNISGAGELFGMKLIFSNDDVFVRVEIDGNEVFEIPVSELRSMNYESHANSGLQRFFGGDRFGEFEFFPRISLKYDTSLKIQVKKTVSWNLYNEYYHIMYSEE